MENWPENLLKQAGSMTKETEGQESNNPHPPKPLNFVLPIENLRQTKKAGHN